MKCVRCGEPLDGLPGDMLCVLCFDFEKRGTPEWLARLPILDPDDATSDEKSEV